MLVDNGAGSVAGFFTLGAASISLTRLPPGVGKGLPRWPEVPCILIGRLAVDRRYQGQGLGGRLLFEALRRAAEASDRIGVALVIVDAKDEGTQRFDERFGFEPLLDQDRRLFLPIARSAAIVAEPSG